MGGRPKQTLGPEWSQVSRARVGNHRETHCGGASSARKAAGWSSTHRLRQPLTQRTRQFQAQQTASGRSLGRGQCGVPCRGVAGTESPGTRGEWQGHSKPGLDGLGSGGGGGKSPCQLRKQKAQPTAAPGSPIGGCGLSGLARGWQLSSRNRAVGATAAHLEQDVPEQMPPKQMPQSRC